MSLLLQALLGANVDGSGSSFHVDGRKSRDTRDSLPMAVGEARWPKKNRSLDDWWGTLDMCHVFL